MDFKNELEKIYALIPEIDCKQGCHACCGPINWSPVEDIVIKEFMKNNNIKDIHWSVEQYVANDLLCPYLEDGKCIIYPVRPIICRLQGHVSKLPCPHIKGFDLSKQKEDEIMRKYTELNMIYKTKEV